MNNLSVDGEFRYIVSWFNEWSELQREDFVPIMVEYLNQGTQANGAVYMNGMMNSVTRTSISDKPMSLFQCRIKLFREWTPKWPLELKHKLKEKITEIDRKVGERISNELSSETELETEATTTTTTTQQCHANGNVDESAYAIVNGNLNGATASTTTTTTTTAITTQPIESTNVSTVEVNAVTNQEESNEIVAVENNENNDVDNGLPSTTNGDSNSANVNGAVNILGPVNAGIVAVEPAEQVVEMQTVYQQQQQQQQSSNNNNAEVPLVV